MRSYGCLLALMLLGLTARSAAADEMEFHWQPAAPGTAVTQEVDFELDMTMSLSQGEAVINKVRRTVVRRQKREVHVLTAGDSGPTRVELHVPRAEQTLREGERQVDTVTQPIAGKTYLVERSDPEADIRVTYPDGSAPPEPERLLVAAGMQTIGRPNPIGRFFDGRKIAVGEKVELPAELARELLGIDAQVGEVKQLEMVLEKIEQVEGARCGVFTLAIDALSQQAGAMTVSSKGRLWLEADTCRAVRAEMGGPVSLAETSGPEAAPFTVKSEGTLRMAARSEYGKK